MKTNQPKRCSNPNCQKIIARQNTTGLCRSCNDRDKLTKRGKLLEEMYHASWYYNHIVKPKQQCKVKLWREE